MRDIVFTIVLEILALPVRLIVWMFRSIRRLTRRDDEPMSVTCEVCGTTVSTVGLSACECGRVEAGSHLHCSCGASYSSISCSTCGVTIDVKKDRQS